jgi:ornithine carbamoyltransferase
MTTTTTSNPPDLLRIADIDAAQLTYLLDLAAEMKRAREGWRDVLRGETVAMLFEKPSTRTRVSLAGAAARLGMNPLSLREDELQLGRGEPIEDTARVLSGFVAAIAIRTFAQAELEQVARYADVPVINALSELHHPCQALADLLTIREQLGSLAGRRLVFVGDGNNNVTHSLLEACALAGMDITVSCPIGYEPRSEIVDGARRAAGESGGHVAIVNDPRAAVPGADAVYTDVWVSMGEEGEQQRRRSDLASYQVNGELMSLARRDAIFLHCLPAHRGQEVTADVIDGPQSVVWQQAANRLPTEQALLYALITGDWTHSPDAGDDL